MLARPEGILIVTGPTGSGKTTTLYSLLAQVNDETVNIMTLEDPVEYPLTLMRQTSVNEVARMDFANGIRSIMRQDPDIILVGEVRDKETAEMAFRAAMTGHQVFTTLHTNSALGAFPRLLDIGIQPDIMAGNIIGVIAQRLVRVLCPHCKEAYAPAREERLLLGDFAGQSSRTSTARWAASSATTRATGAARRSWRCSSWTAIWTSWSRGAPRRRNCVRPRWPGLPVAGGSRARARGRRHDEPRGGLALGRSDRTLRLAAT